MPKPEPTPQPGADNNSLATLERHHRHLAAAHAFIAQKLQRWAEGHLTKEEVVLIFLHQANATYHEDTIRGLYQEAVEVVDRLPDA